MIIKITNNTLYCQLNGFLNPAKKVLVSSNLVNKPGTNINACAKISGITPDAFTFRGIHCLAPCNKFLLAPPVA